MSSKLSPDEVRARLAAKGLSWIGGQYETCRSRLTLRCEQGHTFTVQAQGPLGANTSTNGCRECDRLRRLGPKPRGRDRTRTRGVFIKFYTGHSWLSTEVSKDTTTTELNERYGKGKWRLL